MKSVVVVLALLLTVGLIWGPGPALAEGEAILKQIPAGQPVSDAELSQISGKQLPPVDIRRAAFCVYTHLPLSDQTRQQIATVVQHIKSFKNCFHGNNVNGNPTPQ
jgi:hypothetical protein